MISSFLVKAKTQNREEIPIPKTPWLWEEFGLYTSQGWTILILEDKGSNYICQI